MRFATWVSSSLPDEMQQIANHIKYEAGVQHWSRTFEYPFVLANSRLTPNLVVLDAAGGNGILQAYLCQDGRKVVNIDSSPVDLEEAKRRYQEVRGFISNVRLEEGDLKFIKYPDESFDRIACVSVLEHDMQPKQILRELWRVLKRGGRLVCTFDVASYIRWNHTIDLRVAKSILQEFQLDLPMIPPGFLTQVFDEIEHQLFDPLQVTLGVICFYCDKD